MYAYIPAKDVARARKFYEEKVGLKPKQEIAGGVVYEFGKGTACFLYPTPNAGTSKASQAFWQVDDVERESPSSGSAACDSRSTTRRT
jgi:predicted enzyme related to lactoylglutathione lyase